MEKRLALQEELEELLGSSNVYFQPPENVQLKFDCIVYKLKDYWTRKADNLKYMFEDCYELTLIYRDPDTDMIKKLLNHFEYSDLDRAPYSSDNLYHAIITIYY